MNYSISQVAERFQIEPHTLRYYEKEGIVIPERTKTGIRTYTEENISQLEMTMCLKSTGMSLKNIKKYFDMVSIGDCTLDARLKIFTDHRQHVLDEIDVLKSHLARIEGKICWYGEYARKRKEDIDLRDAEQDKIS
jgi:Predicted transcriptional regulators